jgi:hypothetical protein
MASVTSLDQDMRKLRMDRVTPQAEEEVRAFIQASLETVPVYLEVKGETTEALQLRKTRDRNLDPELLERLGQESLFDFLGDGVALCRYGCLQIGFQFPY